MPLKDPEKRREYLRQYRESGRAAASAHRYKQRVACQHLLCACGKSAIKHKDGAPVCERCLRIQARVDSWPDELSHGSSGRSEAGLIRNERERQIRKGECV